MGHRGLLPEVHRRGLQEGDQGHPDELRPIPHRLGPTPLRAQEVRRPLRPRPLPEVLPMSAEGSLRLGHLAAGCLLLARPWSGLWLVDARVAWWSAEVHLCKPTSKK